MRKTFWILTNIYGKLFGWPFFAPFHHAIITFSLHGLGYGNMLRDSWTGEEWFIKNKLVPLKPKVVFDVGANVGSYSKMLLSYTAAAIYAFEPNPSSFKKMSQINSERLNPVQKAVTDYNGPATLNYKFDFDGMASLDSRIRSGNSVDVTATTLASFAEKEGVTSVDFIKIDTEGHEKEVLSGLGKLKPKYIQFEFNINHLQRDCTFYELTKLLPDYSFYRLLPNGWLAIDPKKYENNIFIFSNIVAVRNELDKIVDYNI